MIKSPDLANNRKTIGLSIALVKLFTAADAMAKVEENQQNAVNHHVFL